MQASRVRLSMRRGKRVMAAGNIARWRAAGISSRCLNELQVFGGYLREDPPTLVGRQSPQRAKHAAEDRPVVVEHRKVSILQQGGAVYRVLLAGDHSAVDPAPQHPVHRAVAVVGAVVAIL